MADHCLSIGLCEKGLMGRKGQTADESIVVDPRLGLPFPHIQCARCWEFQGGEHSFSLFLHVKPGQPFLYLLQQVIS